ncbi:major histocompatibility complex class I UBA precursor [Silurus asotus]|uniref:Major histocompatibility complex class I UBA n=1 Tax=Silurus asotus TaxID=30991 RepID=A0AAD5AFA3_SILAS|nr:major histocompatibility complex class I UBA precursor [Silurus asotus]
MVFIVLTDAHSLEYQYTMCTTNYISFPEFTAVGLLDGKQFMSYSSSNKMLIPENWIKNSSSEDYWKSEEQNMEGHHDDFKNIFTRIKNQFNDSGEGHTLQRMYGCKNDDGGFIRRYDQYGFDGEDFISLDLKTGTWIAVKPQAEILKHNWESNGYTTYWKNFLEHECIDLLNRFVNYGRETLERKVRPEASLFQEEVSPPEVVCHATGFFPKALNISWKKDGEDVHEDMDLSETLPNQDGSFQKRSILNVSAEDLRKHTYTCVIEHSSLEKEMVLKVPRDGELIGIIVGVVVALVVLVAVVAGIVVWKKKNSGDTLQRMYGCDINNGSITKGYNQYGFDGEDFISLDLETGTWIAVKPQALILKRNWESNGYTKYWKSFLEHDCIFLLNTFVNYGRKTVERKDPPEMSLFQTEVSSPEVVCHATGFYPKALLISWQKDGEDVLENVDLRETLPNQDGSFQKRSILKVSAEELQKHTYTCVIEHSSLEKDLVLPVSERRILRDGGSGGGPDGGSDGGSGGGLIGIIVGVIVALVVLVAVVAGIVIWKKKKSGILAMFGNKKISVKCKNVKKCRIRSTNDEPVIQKRSKVNLVNFQLATEQNTELQFLDKWMNNQ